AEKAADWRKQAREYLAKIGTSPDEKKIEKQEGKVDFQREVIEASGPVVAYFWTRWRDLCKSTTEMLDELAGKVKIVKVDVDPDPAPAALYGVPSLPTLLLFRERKMGSRQAPTSKEKLRDWIAALPARRASIDAPVRKEEPKKDEKVTKVDPSVATTDQVRVRIDEGLASRALRPQDLAFACAYFKDRPYLWRAGVAYKQCDAARTARASAPRTFTTKWDTCRYGTGQQAIDACTSIIAAGSEDLFLAYLDRGATYLNMGQYRKATDDLNQAVKLNPDNPRAWKTRGKALLWMDIPGEAL